MFRRFVVRLQQSLRSVFHSTQPMALPPATMLAIIMEADTAAAAGAVVEDGAASERASSAVRFSVGCSRLPTITEPMTTTRHPDMPRTMRLPTACNDSDLMTRIAALTGLRRPASPVSVSKLLRFSRP